MIKQKDISLSIRKKTIGYIYHVKDESPNVQPKIHFRTEVYDHSFLIRKEDYKAHDMSNPNS